MKHTCKSGRTYLIKDDEKGWSIARPCFNGAGFTIQFGTIEDLEQFDSKLRWNNVTGQYNKGN